ncbi:signal transducer and activator of transcription 1-alpha/beta-like isoform X1 [Carassius auratus]|uniref:Signal transducer and activator of transcription n=1 Tax=Carassius auratus TaxID=7957 RepID=A0A6P6Q142_CARAU|nr:signal transducer and activator of transcription 1-alpha/beta-like isoform X1 [Carassius auratus]
MILIITFICCENFLVQRTKRKLNIYNLQEDLVHMAMNIYNTQEKALVSQGKTHSLQGGMMEEEKELDKKTNILKKSVQETEQDIQVLEDLQYEYDSKRKPSEGQIESQTMCHTTKESQHEEIATGQMFTDLHIKREMVMKETAYALTLAEQIQLTLISEELPEWKKRQQMACIGGPHNTCLKQLQSWFSVLAECLQQIRQQLKKVHELVQKFTYNNDPLTLGKSQLDDQALALFKNLVLNSLVVEGQPFMPLYRRRPLVIRKGVQFCVKIRLLVKLPELNSQPKVKISIDKGFSEMDKVKGCTKFFLLGTVNKVMTLDESSGCLAADFRHLTAREMRPSNRSKEFSLNMFEELHLITCDTQLILPELCIDLSITCLPVVMLVRGWQLSAWGSILWYNMLCSEPHNLLFFLNPPPVKWGQLSKVLSWQFSSATKRALNSEQLRTLADKVLGREAQGNPEGLIHWNTFYKVSAESGDSFWQWIYEHLDLTEKYVSNIWNDGYIMGFLSKESEKALLSEKLPGTFLLRFSENSRCGGIIITWVDRSKDGGEPVVHSTNSYTRRDLNNISLPNIIRDYTVTDGEKDPVNPLVYLYPDIPRDVAFGRYYTSASDNVGGINEDQIQDGTTACQ